MTMIENLVLEVSPFDFGWFENLTSIMGMNRWAWLIPTKPNLKSSGFYYDINLDYFSEN